MFEPPCCPRLECPMHLAPAGRFYQRDGYYHALCRRQRIPRFRCKHCRKRFSRQTFRIDYRARKPELEIEVFVRLNAGTGLRRTAESLGVTRSTVERKFRKLGWQLRCFHENSIGEFEGHTRLLMDELETFETCRRTRPLTVPIVIERDSFFVVDACCETLPPRGRLKRADRIRVQRDEERFGKRRNRSSRAVAKVLSTAARHVPDDGRVSFDTDRKKSYPGLIRRAFGERVCEHRKTSSRDPRTTWNPLFRINLTNAMARDLMGRLHRRSWLVSKERRYLDTHLGMWIAHRNYVRRWRNDEDDSPAARLGFVERRLQPAELIRWRQDFGPERSLHPLGGGRQTMADYRRRMKRWRELLAG